MDGGWKGIIYNDAKEGKWNVLKAGLPVRQNIIHYVPGVSTEGGAADWVPIFGWVNNIDKILGIVVVPKCRHDKRLSFDTIGFLEDPKLTRKQRDSRQNIYGDKPKNQVFWSTNTSICTL